MFFYVRINLINKFLKDIKMFATQINKMDMDMRLDHHDDRRISIAFCFEGVMN